MAVPAELEPATRLGVLQAGVVADARRLGVPVSLSVLCQSASAALGVAAVAVSVLGAASGMDTVASSGQLARTGEELQATVGQGPSWETLAGSAALLVEDLAAPEHQARWALFAPGAVEAGIGSLYVVPMRIGAARFGVFVAYLDRAGGPSTPGLGDTMLFAALALDLLLEHMEHMEHMEAGSIPGDPLGSDGGGDGGPGGAGQLGRWALDDRPEIHQATGMVSVQLSVNLPTALLRLRARAFTDGRLLSALAADVVARLVRLDDVAGESPP